MKQRIICKALAVAVIILLSLSATPSSGISDNDDTTPPVTTCTFDPSEPNGENGWYIYVTIILHATDDLSGVKEIRYSINGGSEHVFPGDYGSFILIEDGKNICINYYAVDNAGNVEDGEKSYVDLDGTEPEVVMCSYEIVYDTNLGYILYYTTYAIDATSGMDYVEFYRDNQLKKTVSGPGPEYEWIWEYSNITYFKGLICKREITEVYVKFKAIFIITSESMGYRMTHNTCGYDKAGNMACDSAITPPSPGPWYGVLLFKSVTLPNNYTGHIGRIFISATFDTS
jgi:hypothetical protein